ncbi:MAG: formate dehydrogenase accessory protein FdhE [Desulfobacula sp.]|nr:formate dehydrogenase accessory protein FdhE [Desulfobacula sp.]
MSTIEQLKKSADLIKKNRPSYRDLLGFYAQVFEAQEQSRQEIILSYVVIEDDLLILKKGSDMPLIEIAQFQVDNASAAKLMGTLCDLALSLETDMSKDARHIKGAIKKGVFDPEQLFPAILENRESALKTLAKKINIQVPKLILFGYLSMAPSIAACARQLALYLEKDALYNHGYCPICGSQPDLAFLDEDGKRYLKCCFCSHQWSIKRMGCSFCGNFDPDKQHYFYSDDEKEYRVNLCDSCGNYIKVVDLRQINRYFYPGLELISTLHLDLKAKEKGYAGSICL